MKRLRITIGNRSYDVTVEDLSGDTPAQAHFEPPPVAAPPSSPAVPTAPSTPSPAPQTSRGPGSVISPLAGVVQAVFVSEGDQVQKGQKLVILEAMKMENVVAAPVAGTVKKVEVAKGDSVQEGHVLVLLE